MTKPTLLEKTLAWSVHIFTASGLLAGFMAILAINDHDWRSTMFWLLACLIIDGIDGTFARMFRVKEVLPYMDGKMIDYVIDFATYAIIPAYFFYEVELVNQDWRLPLTFLILLVSALYYGKEGMVSDDNYFIGFPVPLINGLLVVFFAILHFVPIKFAYPSQATRLKGLTIAASIVFLIALPLTVYYYPEKPLWLKAAMILNLVYFGGIATWDTFFVK